MQRLHLTSLSCGIRTTVNGGYQVETSETIPEVGQDDQKSDPGR